MHSKPKILGRGAANYHHTEPQHSKDKTTSERVHTGSLSGRGRGRGAWLFLTRQVGATIHAPFRRHGVVERGLVLLHHHLLRSLGDVRNGHAPQGRDGRGEEQTIGYKVRIIYKVLVQLKLLNVETLKSGHLV